MERRVAAGPAAKQELDELRAVIDRNLQDAALPQLSAEGKFSMAYNAARGLATIAVRGSGYRVKSHGGAHYNTFLALEAALGSSIAMLAAYFDSCRRKRNDLSYDSANVVTDTEVDELLRQVTFLRRGASYLCYCLPAMRTRQILSPLPLQLTHKARTQNARWECKEADAEYRAILSTRISLINRIARSIRRSGTTIEDT